MLHALPFTTFGEIARLGLEVHVSCSSCHSRRRLALDDGRLQERAFVGARFRCTGTRWNGAICGGVGSLAIQPVELLPVGGPYTLAYLFCRRCLPPWEINHVRLDLPPWPAAPLERSDRYRCPGCRGRVDWHMHGPTWRPVYRHAAAADVNGAAVNS